MAEERVVRIEAACSKMDLDVLTSAELEASAGTSLQPIGRVDLKKAAEL